MPLCVRRKRERRTRVSLRRPPRTWNLSACRLSRIEFAGSRLRYNIELETVQARLSSHLLLYRPSGPPTISIYPSLYLWWCCWAVIMILGSSLFVYADEWINARWFFGAMIAAVYRCTPPCFTKGCTCGVIYIRHPFRKLYRWNVNITDPCIIAFAERQGLHKNTLGTYWISRRGVNSLQQKGMLKRPWIQSFAIFKIMYSRDLLSINCPSRRSPILKILSIFMNAFIWNFGILIV